MRSDPLEPRTFKRIAGAGIAAVLLIGFGAACELGEGDCLRMSDCDEGYSCVEGTCRSNNPADAPNSSTDAGARDASRADASTDAAVRDASRADSSSDASDDAASGADASGP